MSISHEKINSMAVENAEMWKNKCQEIEKKYEALKRKIQDRENHTKDTKKPKTEPKIIKKPTVPQKPQTKTIGKPKSDKPKKPKCCKMCGQPIKGISHEDCRKLAKNKV